MCSHAVVSMLNEILVTPDTATPSCPHRLHDVHIVVTTVIVVPFYTLLVYATALIADHSDMYNLHQLKQVSPHSWLCPQVSLSTSLMRRRMLTRRTRVRMYLIEMRKPRGRGDDKQTIHSNGTIMTWYMMVVVLTINVYTVMDTTIGRPRTLYLDQYVQSQFNVICLANEPHTNLILRSTREL